MRTIDEISKFILENGYHFTVTEKEFTKSIAKTFEYILPKVNDTEEILFAFNVPISVGPVVGNTGVIITNKKMIYGRSSSGFLSQGGMKIVDITDINDISFHDVDALQRFLIADSYKINIDTIREEVVMNFGCIKSNRQKIEEVATKLTDILFELKNKKNAPAAVSVADEMLKFKQLLDMGIITQEEFEKKKRELLGF